MCRDQGQIPDGRRRIRNQVPLESVLGGDDLNLRLDQLRGGHWNSPARIQDGPGRILGGRPTCLEPGSGVVEVLGAEDLLLTVADGRSAGYVTIWGKKIVMLELIITLCTIVATGLALAGLIVARWNKLDDRLRTVETGLAELRGVLIHGNIRPKSKPAE